MPKTRNGFYLWCGGLFVTCEAIETLHKIGEVLTWPFT